MENRSGLGQAQNQAKIRAERIKPELLDRVGGWVAKLFAFATSSRVMGWARVTSLQSHLHNPQGITTNANRVCILFFFVGIFQAKLDDVDHALSSRSRSQHEVSDIMQCFQKCRDDSHCLSFNFEYTSVLPTKKCELNDLTKGQDPKNYVKRPGYMYYENVG